MTLSPIQQPLAWKISQALDRGVYTVAGQQFLERCRRTYRIDIADTGGVGCGESGERILNTQAITWPHHDVARGRQTHLRYGLYGTAAVVATTPTEVPTSEQ